MITTAGQDAISDLTARGDLLYFIERDAKLGVDSLWRTNGLSGGLKRLRNFNDRAKIVQKDPNSGVTGRIFVDQINAAGSSRALFAVKDDTVTAITRPGPENFPTARQMGNRLYFSRAVPGGQQLWISDGTFAGTRNRESFTGTQFIGGFTTFNSRVAFVISDSPSYDGAAPIPRTSTLCVTIGLADGVVALKFINTGRTLTLAGALLRGTRLYFTVPDPIAGDDLWFTDGTRPGTTGALSSGFNPQHFSVVKGGMYFSAKNSISPLDGGTSSPATGASGAPTIREREQSCFTMMATPTPSEIRTRSANTWCSAAASTTAFIEPTAPSQARGW